MTNDKRPLLIIIAIYLTLATAHSLIAPLTIGNDEWPHFQYARFIREHGRLPVTLAERQNQAEAGTKADDPPLYHLLVAALAAPIEPTRVLRPVEGDPWRQLADNMVVSYAFIVHTGYELWPYRGEVLLWAVGRAVSILTGAALIALTYATSLSLFPGLPARALTTAALLAFIPAFIFHTSVMTYDGLGAVLTGLLLLAAIHAIRRPEQRRWWLAIGGLAGLAVTTKYTSVLLPLEILFVAWLAWRSPTQDTPRNSQFAINLVLAAAAMLLATSWWFGFLTVNFNTIAEKGPLVGVLEPLLVRGGNDSTAISLTAGLVGAENVSTDLPAPARPRHYPSLAQTLLDSFWAARINEQYLLSPWLGWLFGGLALLSAAGLARVWHRAAAPDRTWLLLLLFHTLLITPLILLRLLFSFDPVEAVQGRHLLLPAATAIPLLLVWGWRQWSRRLARWVVVALLLWSVLGQVGWAALVYPGPLPLWAAELPPARLDAAPLNLSPLPGLRLTGASWQPSPTAPALAVTLWWQPTERLPADYRIELTLRDDAGRRLGAALGQPVQGRYPTRAWEPGDVVRDDHTLPLLSPASQATLSLRLLNGQGEAVTGSFELGRVDLSGLPAAADTCAVWQEGQPQFAGLLRQPLRQRQSFAVLSPEPPRLEFSAGAQQPLASFERLHWFEVQPDWPASGRLQLGSTDCGLLHFNLPPRHFTAPASATPLEANFNDQLRLLGATLPTRRIEPGGRLPLTLYWQALDTMSEDYRMFDNLLDAGQQRRGGYDRRAQDGYSTVLWVPGQVITDAFGVPVDASAPPGIYTLDIGWYRETPAGAESLPLLGSDGQPSGATSIRLGPIKVGGPPPEVIAQNPQPQHVLNQPFGEQITLLGYNQELGIRSQESGGSNSPNSLHLTLFWQPNAIPAADYTTFVHLRDAAGQTVAQKDAPPAAGRYPTSLWDAGEVIVDEISLPLDGVPPGSYTPVIGLYEPASGQRLPIPGHPASEFALQPVTVE